MDTTPTKKPIKEGRKQTVTHGTVILSLGPLLSHKKHRDRYLIIKLPYTRSGPRLDAVSTLTPLGVWEGENSQLQCAMELLGTEKNSISWTPRVPVIYTTVCKALSSHRGESMHSAGLRAGVLCRIPEQMCMIKTARLKKPDSSCQPQWTAWGL